MQEIKVIEKKMRVKWGEIAKKCNICICNSCIVAYNEYKELERIIKLSSIHDVRVVGAKADSSLRCTNVFFILCFGDSTNEQVAVPMVGTDGRGRMK
jgi:hypothetical protein